MLNRYYIFLLYRFWLLFCWFIFLIFWIYSILFFFNWRKQFFSFLWIWWFKPNICGWRGVFNIIFNFFNCWLFILFICWGLYCFFYLLLICLFRKFFFITLKICSKIYINSIKTSVIFLFQLIFFLYLFHFLFSFLSFCIPFCNFFSWIFTIKIYWFELFDHFLGILLLIKINIKNLLNNFILWWMR